MLRIIKKILLKKRKINFHSFLFNILPDFTRGLFTRFIEYYVQTFFFLLLSKYERQKKVVNDIMIIETGNIGDWILSLDMLNQLNYYAKNNNLKVSVLCPDVALTIFKNYSNLNHIKYYTYKKEASFIENIKLIKVIGECCYKYVILRDCNGTAVKFAAGIKSKNKFFYTYCLSSIPKEQMLIYKKIFDKILSFDDKKNTFVPQIWKNLAIDCNIPSWNTTSFKIKNDSLLKDSNKKIPYILICPEASETSRNIDIEKISHILTYLKKNYSNYNIIISTSNKNKDYDFAVISTIKNEKNILFYNNISFSDFIKLIYNSSLVIGCDSGSVHLAAHMNIKSICLVGNYQYNHFYPYTYDIKSDTDPICLFSEITTCSYCFEKKCYFEYPECSKRILNSKNALCIFNIPNEKINSAIDSILKTR